VNWTITQKQRLTELNAEDYLLNNLSFDDKQQREAYFKKIEQELVAKNKKELEELKNRERRPLLCQIEDKLVECLTKEGFVQVVTPILLSRGMLSKMGITDDHPLIKQVFWVDKNKCLRPMLAPNLYHLLKDLLRIWGKPVKIFEVGPCFRKESEGAHHLNEFTMLNLVELNDLEGKQEDRIKELATLAMEAVGINDYRLEKNKCNVYGNTVDIVASDLELGSAAYGPHRLDEAWGIIDPWAGIGFGLERLVVVLKGYKNIHRAGRSLAYLNGVRLNV